MQCVILKKFGHIALAGESRGALISVNVRFTEGLEQMTWFLQVLWFDIINLLCAYSSYIYYIE